MHITELTRGPIVIVGGGVAGLTAANFLAHSGFPVRLFERNEKVGGCCATTSLGGYTFNDGAVFLGMINLLDLAFARVGLDRAEFLPLRKIGASFSSTLPDGTVVTLGEGSDVTVIGHPVDPKRLQSELHRMMHKWQPVLRFFTEELLTAPFSSWRAFQKGWRHLYKLRGSVASEFNRLFSDHAVRSALSGVLLYSGVPAQKMPILAILGLIAEMSDGFYVPEGGMGNIPHVLSCALQSRGVPVYLNSTVEKIIIENGRVSGVLVKDQGRVDASAVISTVSGMLTFGSLIDKEHITSAIARRIRQVRLSHRAVSIQFGLANRIEPPALTMSVLPWMEHQQDMFMQDGREMTFPVYSVPSMTLPELAPRGGSIIELFYPVAADIPLDSWDNGRKERLTQLCISVLSRTHDLDIAVTRVRTPSDFLESMHLFDGALYGLSPMAGPHEQFGHTSTIPGLFLAGQTTFPGYGVGTAMMSGIFAGEALVSTVQ
jgi:phytoene desaturase